MIPALDEEASLPSVLADLPHVWRVVVVDNGSTDRTAAVARAAGAEVVTEPRRGYGYAVMAGIQALTEDPPAVVVVVDADGGDALARLGELAGPVLEGRADLVLCARQAEPGALTWPQRVGNAVAVRGIERLVGRRYADLGPFRAVRWSAWGALAPTELTWGFNVEMQIKAIRLGLRVLEVPMPYGRRRAGTSKISGTMLGTARAGYRIVGALWRHRR